MLLDFHSNRLDDPDAAVWLARDVRMVDVGNSVVNDAKVASSKVGATNEPHTDVCVEEIHLQMWSPVGCTRATVLHMEGKRWPLLRLTEV